MSEQVSGFYHESTQVVSANTTVSTVDDINLVNDVSIGTKTHAEFLSMLGGRVRRQRDSVRMSRRVLSQRSNVSERYLAQLESGKGNMSIGLLRNVSIALEIPLADLFGN